MLNKAIMIATMAHDNQFDKAGQPYILHPLKVMHYLKSDDEELMCIAVLHDVLEDSDVTYEDLLEAGMSYRVLVALNLLTKRKGVRYQDYMDDIASNKDAIVVKMADLRHNMDIRRLKGVTDKDLERLAKYARSYEFLKERLMRNGD